MNRWLVVLSVAVGVWLSGSLALAGGKQSSKAVFELHVGKKVYKIQPDKPFVIKTPKGEKLKSVLKQQETLTHSGHGISFKYHHEMKVSTEEQMGVATITVEGTSSPLCIVQVYKIPISAGEVEKILVSSLENEFKNRKASFLEGSGGKISMKVGGKNRSGRKLDFMLAGQRFNAKVFTFKKGKSVIALMIQNDLEDQTKADKYFSVILNSIR
jgi:hypothetical protein